MSDHNGEDPRRAIPQVDRLAVELEKQAPGPRALAVRAARIAVEAARSEAAAGKLDHGSVAEAVTRRAHAEMERLRADLLGPVVNATGVVLHTNLGRAPLSDRALRDVVAVAGGYSNLEFDVIGGVRGDRFVHVEPMLAMLTGAESALVVNNNAAAVLLVCAALAAGRNVVISRGELIEIGGSFRIPDVLASSGAVLREVGTTNRTHARDYAQALDEHTAFVLKVHPSNYRVVGFTTAPSTADLAAITRRHGVPLVYDVGSGLLGESISDEPPVERALADGADVVCFSGDKLLGGPQAGIVCGRADLVAAMRRHPLMRALRPDKMTLAGLSGTVAAYLEGTQDDELPVRRMLLAGAEDLEVRCRSLVEGLQEAGLPTEAAEGRSVAGGGSLPGYTITGPVARLRIPDAEGFAARMRRHDPPVIARIEDGKVVLDLRTVFPEQDAIVLRAARTAAGVDSPGGGAAQHDSPNA